MIKRSPFQIRDRYNNILPLPSVKRAKATPDRHKIGTKTNPNPNATQHQGLEQQKSARLLS